MKISGYSIATVTIVLMTWLGVVRVVDAQYSAAKQGAASATMTAKLVDPEKKAAKKEATVEVSTAVKLIDPSTVGDKPMTGQGHLHYQVDNGPIIATPAAKLSFHELTPGAHTITVTLVGNDHKPLGPAQKLTVTIPST